MQKVYGACFWSKERAAPPSAKRSSAYSPEQKGAATSLAGVTGLQKGAAAVAENGFAGSAVVACARVVDGRVARASSAAPRVRARNRGSLLAVSRLNSRPEPF